MELNSAPIFLFPASIFFIFLYFLGAGGVATAAAALTFDFVVVFPKLWLLFLLLLLLSSTKGNYFTAQLILQFICAHYAKRKEAGGKDRG